MAPFQLSDVDELTAQTQELTHWHTYPELYWKAIATFPAWTGRVDGQIMACGGIVLPWPKSGECWLAATPRVHEHVISFHRTVVRFLLKTAADLDLRRVTATVREDFYSARTWIKRLGFRYEARLPLFGPTQETHLQYVWFPRGV